MSRNITELKQLNNNRYDYSRISGELQLPNLVEIQTKSFSNFINVGIEEVLHEIFPIVSANGRYSLEYVSSNFEEPKYSIDQCKNRNRTYSKKLMVTLTYKDMGNPASGIITDSGLIGEIPWMTETGTFIIKGVERVIVSQLVRSPSIYFKREIIS